MDPTRSVGATERTRDAGRTDGQTDGRADGVKPVYPQQLRCAEGIINVWVNNGEAGDLRRHRAYYYVTVMNGTPKILHDFCDDNLAYDDIQGWF